MGNVNVTANVVLYMSCAVMCLIGALMININTRTFQVFKFVFLLGAVFCLAVAFIAADGIAVLKSL